LFDYPPNGNYLYVAVLDAHHCGGKKAHRRLVAFARGVSFLVRSASAWWSNEPNCFTLRAVAVDRPRVIGTDELSSF
jgi:hypothetical protein